MNIGFVICTRMKSSRVPNKCARFINGLSILEHLHKRLVKCKIPIIYAYPISDREKFGELFLSFDDKNFEIYSGSDSDPMKRMYDAARLYSLDAVIRVTHDKIFIDHKQIKEAIDVFKSGGHDYLYSDSFTDGTSFEIISKELLKKACYKYIDVERITYAVRDLAENPHLFNSIKNENIRLLIDYEEDVNLMNTIFACLGNDCSLSKVFEFIDKKKWPILINKIPKLTVYTCVYNGERYLRKCIESVINNDLFTIGEIEYILIDDFSNDKTSEICSKYAAKYDNIRYIRNNSNLGLSSSSNIAVKNCRSKYIVRLDADDFFINSGDVSPLFSHLSFISYSNYDVIYPDNYFGQFSKIQTGDECHHVGGAIFKKSSLDFVKFKDGLRNYEGYDLFKRAKNILKIGYLNLPTFFYRQHDKSMSKTNLEERIKIKNHIDMGIEC